MIDFFTKYTNTKIEKSCMHSEHPYTHTVKNKSAIKCEQKVES